MWLVLVTYNLMNLEINEKTMNNLPTPYNMPINMDTVKKFMAFSVRNNVFDHTLLCHNDGSFTLVKHKWENVAKCLSARYVETNYEPSKDLNVSKETFDAQPSTESVDPPATFVRRKNVMTTTAIQQG